MGRSKASPWIIGTSLLCVGILALAWFVLISPQMAQASSVQEQVEQTQAQNVIHRQRVETLKQQFAELDVYKAELAEIATRIPAGAGLPDLIREIDALGAASGVTVMTVAPGVPEDFFPAAPSVTAPEPAVAAEGEADGADDDGVDGEAADAPVPTHTPTSELEGVAGMVAIPVQVTVIGSYDPVTAFVEGLQSRLQRLYVVTSYEIEGQDEAEESNGRPATQEGDAEMTIHGYVYVLVDEGTGAEGAPAAGEQPAEGDTVTS